ncbi:hypothetical protein GCM10007164_20380 [Luteimonas padinae]|uniref:DUF4258 domain-containing protein n=1 Tax=Luteimonas padinae TaxID=1714359 RepID=A0ABV6SX48_9GAMM|nr:DUF4258 domain-containing protein [Luteimonas padinae]GHD72589.1 hypothetical protein GCM10007164_20380 [Luteimonas padinae]
MFKKTRHIEKRMSQRGISQAMVDLVLRYGEEGRAGRVFLNRKSVSQLLRDYRELMRILDKGGLEVVVEGESLITAYNHHGRGRA